jgi:anti-sigma B factor antagonist
MRSDETAPSSGDLTLRSHARKSMIEVMVAGNLDMAAALPLETRVDAVLTSGDVRAVQLDLAQVELVDSAGLGALLAIRERANQLGIELAITRVSDRVRRILDLTGLAEIADS